MGASMSNVPSSATFGPPRRPKTALAEKYGHPLGQQHGILHGYAPMKSGLTPLDMGPFQTFEEMHFYRAMDYYQRERFRGQQMFWLQCQSIRLMIEGFTAGELQSVEALAPLITDGVNMIPDDIPIHPMFNRQRWGYNLPRHLARYPLGNGRPGYWEVSNVPCRGQSLINLG